MALELQAVSRMVKGQIHIHPTTLTPEKGKMNVLPGPTLSGRTSLMRLMGGPARADMEASKAFADTEIGDLSTLSRADQEAEMQWFIDAAKPHAGREIKVVSETITTHGYEAKALAPAFTADMVKPGPVMNKNGTPTWRMAPSSHGPNVPDHPKLAQLRWQNIGDAISGGKRPPETLDALCDQQEKVPQRIERAGVQGDIGQKMNEPQGLQGWIGQPGSPVGKLESEKAVGETIFNEKRIKSWQQG